MAKRKPTARGARREAERAADKLARDRERLFRLEAGGSPVHPVVVETPALVDVTARDLRCPTCGSPMRLEEHAAEVHGEVSLRVARLSCAGCGRRWERFYRVVPRAVH